MSSLLKVIDFDTLDERGSIGLYWNLGYPYINMLKTLVNSNSGKKCYHETLVLLGTSVIEFHLE